MPDHTTENLSVGYWQLSRVHVLTGDRDKASRYAESCLSMSKSLSPLCRGYAYEAKARAADSAEEALAKAYEIARSIDAAEDRERLLTDLREIGPEA